MANTTRISITVTRALRARMEAVAESVNWSAVASHAFEQTIAQITSRRGVIQMEDVVNRLRASKQKITNMKYQDGVTYGEMWASQRAEADELMRLENEHELWTTSNEIGTSAYGDGERFVFMIRPNDNGDRNAAIDFWANDAMCGDELHESVNDPEFIRGFAKGALQVWNRVKDQL